jgi:F-type H+-transporting ATPase subunit a
MDFLRYPRDIATVNPDIVFTIGDFQIANSTLYLVLIATILGTLSWLLSRSLAIVPGKTQIVVESIYEWMAGLVGQITRNEKRTEAILPVIGSIFVFIAASNYAGLLPGISSITYDGVSVFRTPTSDFNTTFALAFGSIVAINYISVKEWGLFPYLGRFFKFKEVYQGFKKGIGAGCMSIVDFFIGLLDIFGEITKVASLSLRLFGNMYAGEVLTTILIGSFAFSVPALWMAMGFLSSAVQAVVFMSLVTVFYTLSIKEKEEDTGKDKEA